jgi:hypothetical protein
MSAGRLLQGPGSGQGKPAPPATPLREAPWWGVLLARLAAGDADHSLNKTEKLAHQVGAARGFRSGLIVGCCAGALGAVLIAAAAVGSQGLATQWAYERGRDATAAPARLTADGSAAATAVADDAGCEQIGPGRWACGKGKAGE